MTEGNGSLFGAAVKRREDRRLITGTGTFLDDINPPNPTYAAILRSPHAHATINAVKLNEARQHPGVVGAFAGADFEAVNPLALAMPVGGVETNGHTPRVLAIDKVRYQGEPVAVVVAESQDIADDAVRLIEVDYGHGVRLRLSFTCSSKSELIRGKVIHLHMENPLPEDPLISDHSPRLGKPCWTT